MIHLIYFIDRLLDLYTWVLIITAVMSWLIAFDVISRRHPFTATVWQVLNVFVEPVLRPIRRYLPHLGGVDVSYIILFLIIYFIRAVVLPNILDAIQ
jgi:YggT family protein